MNKSKLINQYKGLLIDIINEYKKFFEKNNGYYNFKDQAFSELEKIAYAFECLITKKANIVKSAFLDELDSVLYAVDSVLFEHMKEVFENVKAILDYKGGNTIWRI